MSRKTGQRYIRESSESYRKSLSRREGKNNSSSNKVEQSFLKLNHIIQLIWISSFESPSTQVKSGF